MARSQRNTAPPRHPDVAELDLLDILHALSDRTRMTIVRTLWTGPERVCGTFPVDVAPSTLSHHFRVLREAGLIHQRDEGTKRWTSLRRNDIEARFPGLVGHIVDAFERA
ncbi:MULTISPECIES: metalloregulator ArsR/SmtB family transcription factor [unclassified Nocardia]|uniref:ArsR/SmtB family transcription factor n=1 Tax=Nocardia TaxID=1817 RepID=UPI0033C98F4A